MQTIKYSSYWYHSRRSFTALLFQKTLIDAKNLGMHLHFARTDYKNKLISGQFNNESCYIIPEGGYGHLGMLGAATILELVNKNQYTHVCCFGV